MYVHVYCCVCVYPFKMYASSLLGMLRQSTMFSVSFRVASISKDSHLDHADALPLIWNILLFASFVKFCVDLWMGNIEASSLSSLPSNESKIFT